jgi:hypothetical protein
MRMPGVLGAAAILSAVNLLGCGGDPTTSQEPAAPSSSVTDIFTTSIANPTTVTVAPNSAHGTDFIVTNTSSKSGTAKFTCLGKNRITCVSVFPSSVTLAPHASFALAVSWQSGACCTVGSTLLVTDTVAGGRGTQRINIQ